MSEHGWTRHGHRCCDQATGPRPHNIARCGGPVMCGNCAADAAIRHALVSGRVGTTPPTSPAYAAAIDYLGRHVDLTVDEPPRWALTDEDVRGLAAAIGAAGVAAGRAQAAADIRAATVDVTFTGPTNAPPGALPSLITVERAAKIAGGEPRG